MPINKQSLTQPLDFNAKLERYKIKIRSDLHEWCKFALAPIDQAPAKHHKLLIKALTDVANGDCKRLIIAMPPGSAKSTYASVLFPAWLLATKPRYRVVVSSYAAALAELHSNSIRSLIKENADTLGINIPTGTDSVKQFTTSNKSRFKAVGVGGGITGFRFNLIIIDDPFSGRAEADSPAARAKVWDWYRSSVLTRRDGEETSVVIIATRWHEDDLIGRLIQDQEKLWEVISIPALCDDERTDLLGRNLGEPMWPEWQTMNFLNEQRRDIGEREFSALYQQKPVPDGGNLIHTDKIPIIRVEPSYQGCTIVRAWDYAATGLDGSCRNPDYTVGVKMVRTQKGEYIVLDVVRIRGEPQEVEACILVTAKKDGIGVTISLPIDPGAMAKSHIQYLTRQLAGYHVESSREAGSKVARATPFISQMNVGNISLIDAGWNRDYKDELSCFPAGLRDDQVDATSRAFNYLTEKNRRKPTFTRLSIYRN